MLTECLCAAANVEVERVVGGADLAPPLGGRDTSQIAFGRLLEADMVYSRELVGAERVVDC